MDTYIVFSANPKARTLKAFATKSKEDIICSALDPGDYITDMSLTKVKGVTIPAGTPFIVVSTELLNVLDEDELMSIIYHEEGHIKLGHVHAKDQVSCTRVYGAPLIDNMEFELAADAYAASKICPNILVNALLKLTTMLNTGLSSVLPVMIT